MDRSRAPRVAAQTFYALLLVAGALLPGGGCAQLLATGLYVWDGGNFVPAECDALEGELALARETALKYPTVKDAKAAGWRQVTPYVPGIAAHFMNFALVDDKFEINKPEMILYDGTGDDARVLPRRSA